MTQELYRRLRPRLFKNVVGQDAAVKVLSGYLKRGAFPHALMICGPSGIGKTTLGRILAAKLKAKKPDFEEVNCATCDPMEKIKEIQRHAPMKPLVSNAARVWLMDEIGAFARSRFAQEGMLKLLEDPPDHCYFILCTTDPQKILKTIHTRCTRINLSPLKTDSLEAIVRGALEAEGQSLPEAVIAKIVERADGSARTALKAVDAVMGLETEEEQLGAVDKGDYQAHATQLYLALLGGPPKWEAEWAKVSQLLQVVEDEPETVRRIVRACARTTLLKGGPMAEKAAFIIDRFGGQYYDAPELALSCRQVVNGK